MGMVVRSNIMAYNANRQLGMNNSAVSKSLEKLASGFRINRAGDDASGLAISEKMKAQIKGLETASANSQDGISLVQTAEGALTEVHSMLNRMVELATKSANGTMQDKVDREALQSEVESLKSEINRIAAGTNFNGINLLDGSLSAGGGSYSASPADAGGLTGISITGLDSSVKEVVINTSVNGTLAGNGSATASLDADGKLTINVVGKEATGTTEVTNADVIQALKDAGFADAGFTSTIGTISAGTGTAVSTKLDPATPATIAGTRGAGFSINFDAGKTGLTSIQLTDAADTESISNADGVIALQIDTNKDYTANDINKMLKDAGAKGITVGFEGTKSAADIVAGLDLATARGITDGTGTMGEGLTLQVGDTAASFNQVSVSVGDMSAKGLGIDALNIGSREGAAKAIDTIKAAINTVSSNRADLGAVQNRLEYTINNLDVAAENMSAANSRIRDTDMAKEMMNYTKMNVLTQAAQAMLAQANQQPQSVLQLLQ